MIDFFWNVHQQGQIAEAKSAASQAKDEISRQRERIYELEFSLSRMALVSQAMWELLQSRFGITDAELLAKMSEVDLRDGTKDGRITNKPTTCPACRRTVSSQNARCMYCGAAITKPNVFQ